jgi:hypothetical protein
MEWEATHIWYTTPHRLMVLWPKKRLWEFWVSSVELTSALAWVIPWVLLKSACGYTDKLSTYMLLSFHHTVNSRVSCTWAHEQEDVHAVTIKLVSSLFIFVRILFFIFKNKFPLSFQSRFLCYQLTLPYVVKLRWKQTLRTICWLYIWFTICLTFNEGSQYRHVQSTFSLCSVKYAANLCAHVIFITAHRPVTGFST